MKIFIAENGEKIIARDEIQEAAFKKAGLKEDVDEKKATTKK
ncbi:hypothetical protein AB3Z07_05085 [Metabacillus halosaccharovorans]